MKKWSKTLNVSLPECAQCGTCCNCASPSTTYLNLLEKAAEGDEFARDFFSIFVPYKNIDEAKALYPNIINKTLKAVDKRNSDTANDEFPELEPKSDKIPVKVEDLVFYKCRYYSAQKQCLIYEDRPELCRDFPGSPYVILDDNCAFYSWTIECREKYKNLKNQLDNLKKYKQELDNIKYQQKAIALNYQIKRVPEEYKFLWLCPSMSLISPGKSWIKTY